MKWLPLFLLAACAANAPAPGAPACQSCHGSEGSSAPPNALGGLNQVGDRGVGAHTAHLQGTRLGVIVACQECHIVPTAVDAEGHIDDAWPAELKWGDLSKTDGATITWNEDLSCAGTYCHGSTLSGGTLTTPVWTDPDPAQTACGACHGNPPPAPHPSGGTCGECHATARNGFDASLHIDGILQVDGGGGDTCDSCHGANGNPAPPPALDGATSPTDPGVGAHTAHANLALATPVACADCHVVPSAVDDAGHLNGTTEVRFQGRATDGGVSASYDSGSQGCTVYCHDPGLGGTVPTPTWTDVGSAAACGSCHAMPPPSPHPASANCAGCHSDAGPGPSITNPAAHVDGNVTF